MPVAAQDSGGSSGVAMTPGVQAIAGEWVGSYTCAQGDTGLTLTVDAAGRTEFSFYALPGNVAAKPGRFEMRAKVTGKSVEFTQVRWIQQPGGYQMVDLVATERAADSMRGNVFGTGCTTFQVVRHRS